jgi:hypothetical protein
MVEQELPKLTTRVRFPSPAPVSRDWQDEALSYLGEQSHEIIKYSQGKTANCWYPSAMWSGANAFARSRPSNNVQQRFTPMADFLTRRHGTWHFVRRVPTEFAPFDRRGIIRHSTKVRISDA